MSHGLFTRLHGAGDPFALIDTRERRDHVDGHWFGSTNIPLSVLSQKITQLVPDRGFPIHLLDWGDAPARAAADLLSRLGYSRVILCPTQCPEQFGDGFVKGEYVWSKAFGEVVAHACGLPEITPADYIANPDQALLFDVRPTAEYQGFTIPGSASLPNSLLLASAEKLQATGRLALLHCAGRTRSIIGACTLHAAGYKGPFAIFKGGTQAWQLDGHDREFDADRVFAHETDDRTAAQDFLRMWGIDFDVVPRTEVAGIIVKRRGMQIFDVSDDAAKGTPLTHGITRISGTNLIQQTDRSIARYHVPVVLLDHGSGSRAAFAAFWLGKMGFDVSVILLDGPLDIPPDADPELEHPSPKLPILMPKALLQHRDLGHKVVDIRSSRTYGSGHLKGAEWHTISALVSESPHPNGDPVAIVGDTDKTCHETADILEPLGWQFKGIRSWNAADFDPAEISIGAVDNPADECSLFAGRHSGNMQDSRDYLSWEEELPGEIDAHICSLWNQQLKALFK